MNENAPSISRHFLRGFAAYTRWYLRRKFSDVRLSVSCAPVLDPTRPAIVYLNHASWWDPLVCLLIAVECFPGQSAFAPMDAMQLRRYGFFRRIGMFGIERNSHRGTADFLRKSGDVLARPRSMLWLTPQARFADVREHPLRFAAGLAQLALTHPNAQLVPLAIEYVFWNAPQAEVLVRFGSIESASEMGKEAVCRVELTKRLESNLAVTMQQLADGAIRRDPAKFRSLLG